jgi:cell division septum initiation protein DivIVA
MSISEAIAEIGKMAKFAKAFEGADVVLKELAGLEQNKSELTAAITKLKAEREALVDAVAQAGAEAAAVVSAAKATAADVKAAAEKSAAEIIGKAEAKARGTEAAHEVKVKELQAKIEDLTGKAKAAGAAADAAARDLAILTGNLDEAKAKLRALVA